MRFGLSSIPGMFLVISAGLATLEWGSTLSRSDWIMLVLSIGIGMYMISEGITIDKEKKS